MLINFFETIIMEQEELENVSIRQAFEWIRTGHWKLRTFNEWVKAQGAKEYQTGYTNGYDAGYDIGQAEEKYSC